MDRPNAGKPQDKFWEKVDKVISNEGEGPRMKVIPENVQPSLPEGTRNVPPVEVNSCGDNPVQDEPDLVAEDREANNIMLEQTDHFDPMRIDPDPNSEDNGDNASVQPSSAPNSFAREIIWYVGIPVKRDGVRLVLTTRYRDVCEKMSCQAKIGVQPLSNEAAWALFVQTLGSDLPPSRKLVAEDIVEGCKGLPSAIVIMAESMRGEVDDLVWEATLENLKRPGVLEQSMKESVFPILVHSYNRLDKKQQLCFSLCALYPKDWSIPRQALIELCIDEGVIHEDRRWKMYNEGHRLLDELEKACLLEAYGAGSGRVRMHEVPNGLGMLVNLTYLSLRETGIERIPDGVVCKLKKLQHLEADYIAVKGEEVGKLRKLEALQCRFENVNELNEYTLHATTIESYNLVIGARTHLDYWHGVVASVHDLNFFISGKVIIMGEGEYKIGETYHLPRDVKALWIREYGGTWNISSFTQLEELEVLWIKGCDEVLTLSGNDGGQPEEREGQLEERISPPPPGDHCPNLKELQISGCPKLVQISAICTLRN
ncbi:hypothetical protein CRG98_035652 [Punica granatum]|uniref:Uncharacterized protein n=1 Tax=Punica granatum TaxID=22663 RepID=A0A2I0IKU3_PUNGR|nr:hypothetical protein CRG98_035652 [Punica granatum]